MTYILNNHKVVSESEWIEARKELLKKEIVISASVDKVYSALITPEQLTQWFPNITTIEPKVGGKYFLDF